MSEEQNNGTMNSGMTNGTTSGTAESTGGNSWVDNLPPPGSDPFGADSSDEITLIGGKPELHGQKKLQEQDVSNENNIDFDDLLSDTVPTNNGNSQPPAQEQPQGQPQGQTAERKLPEGDIRKALNDYSLSVVDSFFNAEGFAKQLTESDPNAVALALKDSFSGMYQQLVQDSMLFAKKFASDAMKQAVNVQQEQFTAREQAQILKSTLAPYPDLNKAVYKPVVKAVYEKAIAKGKGPQEAANLVVAYFRKNIPNAIQEPAQTKQTDGSSINDIWANFR